MKVLAINGSPRRDCNTAKMLQSWVDGVKTAHPDVEVEFVNLYTLKFTGCTSCFSCKRIGGKFYGQCPVKDDLLTLIPKFFEADAVAIGSPIYLGEIDGYTRCLLERVVFSHTTYRKNHDSLAPKPVPVTMVYTMNAPQDVADKIGYVAGWESLEMYVANTFRHPVRRVCAYNTYQFRNYADYEMEIFTEDEKRKYRDTHFAAELQAAFDAGKEAIS